MSQIVLIGFTSIGNPSPHSLIEDTQCKVSKSTVSPVQKQISEQSTVKHFTSNFCVATNPGPTPNIGSNVYFVFYVLK